MGNDLLQEPTASSYSLKGLLPAIIVVSVLVAVGIALAVWRYYFVRRPILRRALLLQRAAEEPRPAVSDIIRPQHPAKTDVNTYTVDLEKSQVKEDVN